jgi:hypothetical protein
MPPYPRTLMIRKKSVPLPSQTFVESFEVLYLKAVELAGDLRTAFPTFPTSPSFNWKVEWKTRFFSEIFK